MVHVMDKATQSLAIVLLGLGTLYVLAERSGPTLTVGLGLIIVISVGLSLWYQTAQRYGATILLCLVTMFVLFTVK